MKNIGKKEVIDKLLLMWYNNYRKKKEVKDMTNIKQQYQVTLICKTGAYKPVSCIIEVEQKQGIDLTKDTVMKKGIIERGVNKICASRFWTAKDLQKYGYLSAKIRLYDKLAIEKQKKENYEKLKEQKYASGEWKRPKNKASK